MKFGGCDNLRDLFYGRSDGILVQIAQKEYAGAEAAKSCLCSFLYLFIIKLCAEVLPERVLRRWRSQRSPGDRS